jgi:hypothetical protein
MEDFKRWLIKAKGLSEKSARDVLSRYKRVQKIHTFKAGDKENKILNGLNECEEFNKLSMFIRSQLRRSIRLYKEFQNPN